MTRDRSARRHNAMDWEAAAGWDEGARDGARAHALTGLDLMPRGVALVRYVADTLARTDLPAASIAGRAGYRVETCAARLAGCGFAQLGRDLLSRAIADQMRVAAA